MQPPQRVLSDFGLPEEQGAASAGTQDLLGGPQRVSRAWRVQCAGPRRGNAQPRQSGRL